jgi:very-short-patch-repair endonuclease
MTQPLGSLVDDILANVVRDKKFVTENPRDWSEGKQFVKRRITETLTLCTAAAEDAYHKLKDLCESPIECLGFVALLQGFPTANAVRTKAELKTFTDWQIAIIPQMVHANYRLDFGVVRRETKSIYSLECDGKYFHRDKNRDIDRTVNLWKSGVLVHRVDGSALCRSPSVAIEPFVRKVMSNG